METTAYIAMSRQVALRRRMDVIANNIANMTTSGFRAEGLLLEPVIADAGMGQRLAFVQDVATFRDAAPGPLTVTGNLLDLAIEGDGYIAVQTDAGVRYARGAQFKTNAIGEVVTAAGDPVLDGGGQPIVIPEGAPDIAVAEDGTISASGQAIGRIDVVAFDDEQQLRKVGGGLYATEQAPRPSEGARLVQGMLEGSNVQPILEMTRMMTTVRAYQGTQRVLDTHHELQRRAVERMLRLEG